jgi:ketosteroid isomerase-like protein
MASLFSITARIAAVTVSMILLARAPMAGQPAPDRAGQQVNGAAQTATAESPIKVATDINVRRSTLYRDRDTNGAASLYTLDATYIELMPIFETLKGRDQIKGHFEELIGAGAAEIVPTVRDATLNPEGTILVSGDYAVISRTNGIEAGDAGARPDVSGHFAQILRRDQDGNWRIAMHAFARPEAITAKELESDRHD